MDYLYILTRNKEVLNENILQFAHEIIAGNSQLFQLLVDISKYENVGDYSTDHLKEIRPIVIKILSIVANKKARII